MMRERGGAVRMTVNEKALGKHGLDGIKRLEGLGFVAITPLVGTTDECDVRLTDLGVKVAEQVYKSIRGA